MKLPADLRLLLERRYDSRHRDWLAGSAGAGAGEPWPLTIALGLPTEAAALRQPDAVRAWAAAWRDWRGPGTLRWAERRWKVLGVQTLPEALLLHQPEQVAAWAGEQERWCRAVQRNALLLARWPALAQRLARLFAVLADYADADFQRLLDLLDWLLAHPASGLYPRQLPVAGIDSKWLETRSGVLAELLAALRGTAAEGADWHALCGLKRPPPLLRMRVLDPALRARVGGLGDMTAPVNELAQLDLPISTVLIVENLQTGLALGDLPGTVAFMALGYGVDQLAQLPWLRAARCLYWGDIDTHGYAILNRARAVLPHLVSVLMEEATLLRFKPLWSDEKVQHGAAALDLLTPEESTVCRALKMHQWGQAVRLEQERIAWDHAWTVLSAACAGAKRGN